MTKSKGQGLEGGLTNYGDPAFAAYLRRSFARSMGYSRELLAKPVVGIAQTASGFNNCHRGVPELVEAVKRGVLAAGALPIDFPVISLGEVFLSPTSMFYRNLMAMAAEEMIRGQPMDAVVLVGGCDKTLPALVMGAASAGKPAIVLATGPMMTSRYRGERLGACTDCRRFWAKYRAGGVDSDEIETIEGRLATTEGTCAVMGTASTMAILIEVLGLMLPGTAAIPAVHADRLRAAEATGRAAVDLIGSGRTIDRIVTRPASTTRSGRCSRSRARPTPSCILPRWPDGSGSSSTLTASTASPTRRRSSSTSSRRARATWRISSPPAASAGSCSAWARNSTSRLRPSPARRSATGSCPRAPSSIRR